MPVARTPFPSLPDTYVAPVFPLSEKILLYQHHRTKMRQKRAHRISAGLRHSVWSVADAALYPAVYMATVPLMMRRMGADAFGFWIILNTLMTTLQLCNMNLGVTSIRYVSAGLAEDNDEKVTDSINAIFRINFIIVIAVMAIGGLLSFTVAGNGWWGLHQTTVSYVFLCLLLAVMLACLKFFDQVFQGVLKAREHYKTASLLNMVNRFGLLLINLSLALYGSPVITMLWVNVLFNIAYLVAYFLLIRRAFPAYRIRRVHDRSLVKLLLRFSVWPWLQSIVIVLAFQTDRFWVSSYSGLKAVSVYGLVSTMFNHIHMIFIAMAAWMMPRLSAMTSRGDNPTELYTQVRNALLTAIVTALLCLHALSPFLFGIWVGDEMYSQMSDYLRAFIVFELVFAHTIMPFFYLNASGRERAATVLTLLYCGLSYACMLGGLYFFGNAASMVLGMALAIGLTMPVANYVTAKKMGSPVSAAEAVAEMLPMYLACAFVYAPPGWIGPVLLVLIALTLWRSYVAELIKGGLWRRLVKA